MRKALLNAIIRTVSVMAVALALGSCGFHLRGEATYAFLGPGPGGETRELRSRGALVVDALDRPGPYALFLRPGGERLCDVAVRFADASESDLRALKPGNRPASVGAAATVEAGFSGTEAALLLAILLLVLLDWLVLSRAGARFGPAVPAGTG